MFTLKANAMFAARDCFGRIRLRRPPAKSVLSASTSTLTLHPNAINANRVYPGLILPQRKDPQVAKLMYNKNRSSLPFSVAPSYLLFSVAG
jgi:hypothetical protein